MKEHFLPLILCLFLNPLQADLVEFGSTVHDWDSGLMVTFNQPFAMPPGEFSVIRIEASNLSNRDVRWSPVLEDRELLTSRSVYRRELEFVIPAGSTVYEDVVIGGTLSPGGMITVGEHILHVRHSATKNGASLIITSSTLATIIGEVDDSLYTISVPPKDFPTKALGLASINLINFHDSDWKLLNKLQQQAILDWVSLGGTLVFWIDLREHEFLIWIADLQDSYASAKGRVLAADREKFIFEGFRGSEFKWNGGDEFDWAEDARRRLEQEKVAGAEMVILLVCFAVAGLVIILLLSRKSPVRVLSLLPRVSVVACLLIMARFIQLNGIGSEGALLSIHIIQPEGQLAVVNKLLIRSGILFSNTIEVPDGELLLYPAGLGMGKGTTEGHRSVKGIEHGGWLTNRRVSSLVQLDFVPGMADVELTIVPEPAVVSNIPAVLHELVVADQYGDLWFAESIQPGQQVALRPLTPDTHPLKRIDAKIWETVRAGSFVAYANNQSQFLRPPTDIKWIREDQFFLGPVTSKP